MALVFPTVTDKLAWPTGERSVRSDVRGLHTAYRHQMAVRVRGGVSLVGCAYGFFAIMAAALLTVTVGHGL